jgi:hypothetical protein
VLVSLRDDVWPHYRRCAPQVRPLVLDDCTEYPYLKIFPLPAPLRERLLSFATARNLVHKKNVPTWVFDVFDQLHMTLHFWTAHPKVTEAEHLRWWIRGGYAGMQKAEDLAIELPRIERSIYEDDKEFDSRVSSAIAEMGRQRDAIDRGGRD